MLYPPSDHEAIAPKQRHPNSPKRPMRMDHGRRAGQGRNDTPGQRVPSMSRRSVESERVAGERKEGEEGEAPARVCL